MLDVYCKPRSANEFNSNDSVTLIKTKITEVLSAELHEKQVNDDCLDLYHSNVTLRTNKFYKYSDIEKIKQQSSILCVHLQLDNEKHRTSVLYLLIQLFSVTSTQDIETRNLFLQNILMKTGYLDAAHKIQTALASTLQKHLSVLPQDFRWLPDAMYSHKNTSGSNKTFLVMYLAVRQFIYAEEVKAVKKHKGTLLIEYMENVLAKKVEAKIEDVFVIEALNLFKAYDDFLQKIVHDENVVINDQQLIHALSCIRWRYILSGILCVNIQKMKSAQLYEMVVNLHIHYKWFTEFAVNKLAELLRIPIAGKLHSILRKIDAALSKKFSAIRKVAEYYQEQINRPPPLINNVQLEVVPRLHAILKKYNIYDKHNNLNDIMKALTTEEDLRFYLVTVKIEIDFQFTKIPENFCKLQEIDARLCKTGAKACNKYMVHMLPLVDYYTRVIALKLKSDLDIQGYENLLSKQLTMPCSLAGVLLRYNETNDERLKHEITTEVHQYLIRSAACMPQNFLNFQDDVEDDNVLMLPQFAPLLSVLVLKVLMSNEKSVLTRFGNGGEVTNQRQAIGQLIWRNMQQMSDIRYDQL